MLRNDAAFVHENPYGFMQLYFSSNYKYVTGFLELPFFFKICCRFSVLELPRVI